MRWTDGELKSTYHRVRAPKKGDPTVSGCVGAWVCGWGVGVGQAGGWGV